MSERVQDEAGSSAEPAVAEPAVAESEAAEPAVAESEAAEAAAAEAAVAESEEESPREETAEEESRPQRRVSPLLSRARAKPLKHDLEPLTLLSSSIRVAFLAAGLAILGWLAGVYILLTVVCLVGMLFLHELGHYLTAKWSGMKVSQFFLGFGPRIWSFKRGETTYGIKPILLGAYVRILGMNNLEKVDPSEEHRTYRSKPYSRRLIVATAGSGMHFLIAIVIFWVLHSGLGFYGVNPEHVVETTDWQIQHVQEGSAADEFGLQPGDRIAAIGDTQIRTFNDLRDEIVLMAGQPTEMSVARDGELVQLQGRIGGREENPELGFLGVTPSRPDPHRQNVVFGLGSAFADFGEVSKESVKGIIALFSLDGLDGLLGPLADFGGDSTEDSTAVATEGGESIDPNRAISIVGILDLGGVFAQENVVTYLVFLASLNIFFGILNLLPMLPLDGGHVVIATYERLRSRRGRRYQADVAKMLPVVYVFLLFLLTISVVALSRDILDPIDLSVR